MGIFIPLNLSKSEHKLSFQVQVKDKSTGIERRQKARGWTVNITLQQILPKVVQTNKNTHKENRVIDFGISSPTLPNKYI